MRVDAVLPPSIEAEAADPPAPRPQTRSPSRRARAVDGGRAMISGPFDAVIPILCVDAGGPRRPARRGVPRPRRADADRRPGDHRPGRRRRRPRSCCGTATPTSFGVVTADNFALFVNLVLVVVGILTVVVLVADDRARPPAGRRVLRDDALRDRRHDADGAGHRPAGHLPRARDDVDCGLRPDRHPPRSAAEHRGGVQVLPARRVRQLVLPLRHRVPLRRDRHHQPRAHRRR